MQDTKPLTFKDRIFPHKIFLAIGTISSILIPIVIAVFFVFIMGKKIPSVSYLSNIYLLLFSNLILMNIYNYFAKLLYENFSDKRIEIAVSGVAVLAIIIFFNSTFWNEVFLKRTSSTDIFIILIIPIYGIFSMLAGFLLGYLIKRIINKAKVSSMHTK